MKDVAVEQMQGIQGELVRDPRQGPGVEAFVVVVSRELVETGDQRPRVKGCQQREDHQGRQHRTPGNALHRIRGYSTIRLERSATLGV